MVHIEMHRPQNNSVTAIPFGILVLFLVASTNALLIFPTSTVLQLTASMSVPVDLPNRKLFVDLGFQMNYNLPFTVSAFYNPTIWANAYERRQKREPFNLTGVATELLDAESNIHPRDYTAGELYAGFERILADYGFHRSCLLRSVCELALHPLAENHDYSYRLMAQIISFLLTPSQHDGFGPNEKLYKHRYERAEKLGFLGGNCEKAYPKCDLDVLNIVTKLVR